MPFRRSGALAALVSVVCALPQQPTVINSQLTLTIPAAPSSATYTVPVSTGEATTTLVIPTQIPKVPFQGNDSAPTTKDWYPTPEAQGQSGGWKNAVQRARKTIQSWTLEQKANITTGVGWMNGNCVGNIAGQPEVGFPGLCLQDSPLGLRFSDYVSSFPAGINAATTWDRDLLYKRGAAMAREAKGKGVNVLLGPMFNLGRLPAGGRNWEGFGADPYLAAEAAYETIKGTQGEGVIACAKHYIANEQEHYRVASSSNVDDRTLHELYLHPFLRSVQADVGSVMCSYNQVNNSWACQNPHLLNGILKTELAYQGFVMSDWQATMSGVSSVNAGLDMTMPGDTVFNSNVSYFGANLTTAVRNGTVNETRVDDMATRILAAWYLLQQDNGNYPATANFVSWDLNGPGNAHKDVQEDHYQLIREIGAASTVLLKNEAALPLTGKNKPRTIAIIGSDASPSSQGPNYSGSGGPLAEDAGGKPSDGTLAIGWGSGVANLPYLIDPLSALQTRARKDRTTVKWWLDNWNLQRAAKTAQYADAALVFASASSGEQYVNIDGNEGDRNNLTLWDNGNELIQAVASSNNNTIVVLHTVGPVLMEDWIEHPNITAVLWAGLQGQESGNSLVDVVYGDVNPSGKLPYSLAKTREDYGADVLYFDPALHPQINYTEGLFIDYRGLDHRNITPRYPFGHGISYTTFAYSNLQVRVISQGNAKAKRWPSNLDPRAEAWSEDEDDDDEYYGSSVKKELHEKIITVSFEVKNNGTTAGAEVAQMYIEFPASAQEPPRVLRDFDKVFLTVGESKTVTLQLSQYDLSTWNVEAQRWRRVEGEISIAIGSSSRDIRLHGKVPSQSE